LNNLQSTVGKLHSATQDINKIQSLLILKQRKPVYIHIYIYIVSVYIDLVGELNHNCDILNQVWNELVIYLDLKKQFHDLSIYTIIVLNIE